MEIIKFKKKKTDDINKQTAEIIRKCKKRKIFAEKNLKIKMLMIRKYCKVDDHCLYTGRNAGAAHSIYNWKYSVPKEIPVVSHTGSNYDYNFLIKYLAQALDWEINLFRKKYIKAF